jgi:hypothetical protein
LAPASARSQLSHEADGPGVRLPLLYVAEVDLLLHTDESVIVIIYITLLLSSGSLIP